MKKASLISIGNEVLTGQTVDTNSAYLARELLSAGIAVASRYTVGDDVDLIKRAFERAGADGDVIIATGGLGPTDDDLTRYGLAEFLGVELQEQGELVERMRAFFAARNLTMPEKNRVQALIPRGAKALGNELGTAAGIMAEADGKLVFALPGVPAEMKRMFGGSVLPRLRRLAKDQAVEVRTLRCFGAGESTIAEMLGPVMERGRNPLINCTVEAGVISLHIVATAGSRQVAKELADEAERSIRAVLGELIFGTGQSTLSEVVGAELAERGKTIAVAESCTGGMLAKLLTDAPGASAYFTYGWVAYSNRAKASELGVPPEMLERYGAVSEQVAGAMARGARKRAGSDFAIGITGIAGPGGATEQKPVGLVYICVDSRQRSEVGRFCFAGERNMVRLRASQTALNMLRLLLMD